MSLLVLMYHRARAGQHGNSAAMLDAHFAHIAAHHRVVLPGEPLAGDRLNVCLTFDDAFFDFHAIALPLLRKHNLRALLAVVPGLIRENTGATRQERLNAGTRASLARPDNGAFCTWGELQEVAASGRVMFAAHGFTHQPLDAPGSNHELEIDTPRTVLSSRLGRSVESFVLPYGRFTRTVLQFARERYRHVFRIGGALNRSWEGQVLYRVGADRLSSPQGLFSPGRLLQYRVRGFWNRCRQR
jgi:peptidoglycan/xylan/chitin deacetylase (PgdA/CDA1 family)